MMFFFLWTLRVAKYLAIFLAAVVAIWFTLALWKLLHDYRVCAELPNGLLVGRTALVDPREYYWKSNVTLKLPDGTVLVDHPVHMFKFSETTAFGWAGPRFNPDLDYAFAYRADVGFILKSENLEAYEKLRSEVGPLIWVYGGENEQVHIGLLLTYFTLIKNPTYRREQCPLAVFPR